MSRIRIIGGKWRGHYIPVSSLPGLRPTGNRIRETLFNWLRNDIEDAICLDLFAGSGALGFEALSRGAMKVIFVDRARVVVSSLKKTLQLLAAGSSAEVYLGVMPSVISAMNDQVFDIIFLDPPFGKGLIVESVRFIDEKNLLRVDGLLYVESDKREEVSIPLHYECLSEKTAGEVRYALYRRLK